MITRYWNFYGFILGKRQHRAIRHNRSACVSLLPTWPNQPADFMITRAGGIRARAAGGVKGPGRADLRVRQRKMQRCIILPAKGQQMLYSLVKAKYMFSRRGKFCKPGPEHVFHRGFLYQDLQSFWVPSQRDSLCGPLGGAGPAPCGFQKIGM